MVDLMVEMMVVKLAALTVVMMAALMAGYLVVLMAETYLYIHI